MAAALATLTDAMVSTLNSSPGSVWSDYTVGTAVSDFVKAEASFDPENVFQSGKTGLYIVPVTVQYNRDSSAGRGKLVTLSHGPVIAICLSYRFPTHDPSGQDVSTWPLIKKILNLREEIDTYLLKQTWRWNISGITAEPAQEIPLKNRMFLSVTEIEFEGMTC